MEPNNQSSLAALFAPAIKVLLRPFLLKKLPDLFADFDNYDCDYALVDFKKNSVSVGSREPLVVKAHKEWDILDGIETQKFMGQNLSKTDALDFVSGLSFERFATETVVTVYTCVEDIGDLVVTYKNEEIWKETLKQGRTLK